MANKNKDGIDTFLVDSVDFIAQTVVNDIPCNVFSFEDRTQNFYPVATENERLAMGEHIQNSLTPTFIRFFDSYANTLRLKSAEMVTEDGAESKIVFQFENGLTLSHTYKDSDIMREHHVKFHEEWEKLKRVLPSEHPNPTRILH